MDRVAKDYHHSTEIRKSYEILPLQGVWSWLTGKNTGSQTTSVCLFRYYLCLSQWVEEYCSKILKIHPLTAKSPFLFLTPAFCRRLSSHNGKEIGVFIGQGRYGQTQQD
jgi:hypothetical protein